MQVFQTRKQAYKVFYFDRYIIVQWCQVLAANDFVALWQDSRHPRFSRDPHVHNDITAVVKARE